MSRIDEHIQKLKETEKRLKLEQTKIQMLDEIFTYVSEKFTHYEEDARDPVLEKLADFVRTTKTNIEDALDTVPKQIEPQPTPAITIETPPSSDAAKKKNPNTNVNEKLNFAMDYRHLAGKSVQIESESGELKGTVVGLDAPFVLVKTKDGPTIKVPVEKLQQI